MFLVGREIGEAPRLAAAIGAPVLLVAWDLGEHGLGAVVPEPGDLLRSGGYRVPASTERAAPTALTEPPRSRAISTSNGASITLTFAGDVALALALAKHSADKSVARQQFERTSDGAVAFKHWSDALVVTYLDATGGHFGTPRLVEDQSAPATGDENE